MRSSLAFLSWIAFLGIAIGWLLAFAGTRFLSKLLQGVSPTDPLIFVAVPALLAAVAIFASLLPARRATQTDPMIALRYE